MLLILPVETALWSVLTMHCVFQGPDKKAATIFCWRSDRHVFTLSFFLKDKLLSCTRG